VPVLKDFKALPAEKQAHPFILSRSLIAHVSKHQPCAAQSHKSKCQPAKEFLN